MATWLPAQAPNVHYLHHGIMPPGAIGSQQLQRGGPLPGFYQPVEIKVPSGALISLAVDNQFDEPKQTARQAGFLIGAVYRLRVANIRMAEGVEVFPTIEIIDRLYAPQGQERRFPIPIQLTEEDLKLAADGKFVTRVIYLEDPRQALPARTDPQLQNWFEAVPGQDPLAVADGLGRPVAILRMGARLPDQGMDPTFFFGSPPFVVCAAEDRPAPPPAAPGLPTRALSPTPRKSAVPQPKPAAEVGPPQADESSDEQAAAKVTLLPPPPSATKSGTKKSSSGMQAGKGPTR